MKSEAASSRLRRYTAMLLALVTIFTLAFEIPSAPAATTYKQKVTGTCNYSYAQQIVTYTNQLRSSKGVSTVRLDKDLTKAAMQRAAEISVSFGHTRPDGSAWSTVNSRVRAENIASGYTSPQSVYNGWYNSSGHYANMVRAGYTAIGVGCFYTNGKWYWVQLFGNQMGTAEKRRTSVKSTFTVTVKGTDPAVNTSYSAPKLTAAKCSAKNEMKFTWTPVQGITDYEIACLMPGASDWVTIKMTGVGYSAKLDTVLMGLVYTGKYSIKLRGVYKKNGKTKYTGWSATRTVKIK